MKITFYEINEVEWERERAEEQNVCVCVNVLIKWTKKDHSGAMWGLGSALLWMVPDVIIL